MQNNNIKKVGLAIILLSLFQYLFAQSLSSISKGFYITCGDDQVPILNPELGSDSSSRL